MHLLNLPIEILRDIFEYVALYSLDRIMHARLVCSKLELGLEPARRLTFAQELFNEEAIRAVCSLRLLETTRPGHMRYNGDRLLSAYLLARTLTDHEERIPLCKIIKESVQYIIKERPQDESRRLEYTRSLCLAAIQSSSERGVHDLLSTRTSNQDMFTHIPSVRPSSNCEQLQSCTIEENAFAAAIYLGLTDIAEYLLDGGLQDKTTYYGSPLYCAVRAENVDLTRKLLKRNFTVKSTLWIPLARFKRLPKWQCSKQILQLLQEPQIISHLSPDILCAAACWAASAGHITAMLHFMKHVVGSLRWTFQTALKPNLAQECHPNDIWLSVVYIGIYFGQQEVVKLGIECGILSRPVSTKNVEAFLNVAALRGYHDIARMLLSNWTPQSRRILKRVLIKPLATAARGGWLKVAKVFLEYGADPNLVQFGWPGSALTTAVSAGEVEMLRMLFKNGLDLNKTKWGRDVVAVAKANPLPSILHMLGAS